MKNVKISGCWIFIFLDGWTCLERRRNEKCENFTMLNFYIPGRVYMSRTKEKWKKWKLFVAEFLISSTGKHVSNGGEMKNVKIFRCWIFFSLTGIYVSNEGEMKKVKIFVAEFFFSWMSTCVSNGREMKKVKIFRCWIFIFMDGYTCLERRRNEKGQNF